jgi:hypothetical protein
VKGVLKVFLPLALALLAAATVARVARVVGALPRPAEAAGHSLAPLLRRAFPSAQSAAVVVFASYTALVYGRRGLAIAVPAAALCIVHALAGPHPFAEFAGGAAAGVALGVAAYGLTLRVSPGGHVAHRRDRRDPGTETARPGSP